jgi:hypothetical protein
MMKVVLDRSRVMVTRRASLMGSKASHTGSLGVQIGAGHNQYALPPHRTSEKGPPVVVRLRGHQTARGSSCGGGGGVVGGGRPPLHPAAVRRPRGGLCLPGEESWGALASLLLLAVGSGLSWGVLGESWVESLGSFRLYWRVNFWNNYI